MAALSRNSERGRGNADGAGDELNAVLAGCQDELYGMLCFLVGDAEGAGAAFQQTFAQCWRYRRSAAQVVDLRVWMFRIGFFAARDARNRARGQSAADEHPDVAPAPKTFPHNSLSQEPVERVRQSLQRLKQAEKEVFLLRQNGKLTFAQIAETINRPEETARARMRAALRNLQATLDGNHP